MSLGSSDDKVIATNGGRAIVEPLNISGWENLAPGVAPTDGVYQLRSRAVLGTPALQAKDDLAGITYGYWKQDTQTWFLKSHGFKKSTARQCAAEYVFVQEAGIEDLFD